MLPLRARVVWLRVWLSMLLVGVAGLGCSGAESGGTLAPLPLRVVCGVQAWLERHEFRIRGERIDRCSTAGRALKAGQERALEILRRGVEPPADPAEAPVEEPDEQPSS